MAEPGFNVFNVRDPKIKTLHLGWVAFFITFFMWFCHASLMPLIKEYFHLTSAEAKALLVLNVALTIPARTIVGMLVDKYGPKIMFTALLVISGIFCIGFSLSQNYTQLALMRFLLGFSGAGFVIGIRLMTEWFPVKEAGTAQGIYGGWGNFGAAAAGFILPALAGTFGGDDGWRYAIASSGIIAILYSFVFYRFVKDTPKGSTYFTSKKIGAMEVTSRFDLFLYMIMTAPMFIALAILTWRLSPTGVDLLSDGLTYGIYAFLAIYFIQQIYKIYEVNKDSLQEDIPAIHQYKFKQVSLLSVAYMVTFGSEVAVVSMLALHFTSIFPEWSLAQAAAIAASFMAMNLFARPLGGYFSDKLGRRLALLVVLAGSSIGYYFLSLMDGSWSAFDVLVVVIPCSFFVQAGAGAVFAVVPLIKRRLTGQIAGMAGAYGNVGAATFLLIYSLTDAATFFTVISISCAVVLGLIAVFLDEPAGHIAEINDDGTVELIQVGK
ncbi:MAG: NNP family nitrate/nitrite transporter-like MFS transporter [Bermanella sp.]|jgi:NNP family nitrate/nitrite transporter-like MFS transporter